LDTAEHWLHEIYSNRWTAIFRRDCSGRFARFTDPEQLMEDARQQLALSLQRMRERGADAPLTAGYILAAFRNALTDLHRQSHGRAEPRPWLKAFGRLGQLLFELYCLARQGRAQVIAALQSDPALMRQSLDPQQATGVLNEMDRRGECDGLGGREEPLFDGTGAPLEVPDHATPERALMEAQSQALQAYLFRGGAGSFDAIQHLVQRLQETHGHLRGRLELDDDQGFILQATLSGELTEAEMGKLLGGLSVRQVRYKREQALEKLKKLLQRTGLDLDALLSEDGPDLGSALGRRG
jgi:hypothetical protein